MEALRYGHGAFSGAAESLLIDSEVVPIYHARPDGMPRAGLVIATDIGGLRPLFADMADRLASHGFAVMAVEPFARQPATREKAAADRFNDVAQLRDAEQVADLVGAADALVIRDDVTRVALVGFCLGGMFALKGATTGRFDWTVACYGMVRLPDGWNGPGLSDALAMARDVGTTLAVFGGADPWTPTDDIDALRACWANRPDCETMIVADADHGFIHDPQRPAHRPVDARAVWDRILAWK